MAQINSVVISNLILAAIIIVSAQVASITQGRYDNLKKWVGKHPTFDRSVGNFFDDPKIRSTLKSLLKKNDFIFLTKSHTKEAPVRIIDDYLQVYVCGSSGGIGCDRNTLLVINLVDESVHVAFDIYSDKPSVFSAGGKFSDLPNKVKFPSAGVGAQKK